MLRNEDGYGRLYLAVSFDKRVAQPGRQENIIPELPQSNYFWSQVVPISSLAMKHPPPPLDPEDAKLEPGTVSMISPEMLLPSPVMAYAVAEMQQVYPAAVP